MGAIVDQMLTKEYKKGSDHLIGLFVLIPDIHPNVLTPCASLDCPAIKWAPIEFVIYMYIYIYIFIEQ